MLLFALFTLGYLFGVVFTLSVFLKREVVSGTSIASKLDINNMKKMDSWEIHSKLTQINDGPNGNKLGTESKKGRFVLPGRISIAGLTRG